LVSVLITFSLVLVIESACPCSDQTLCKPITSAPRKELFVFGGPKYKEYDWSKITTLAWCSGTWDPEVICYAHQRGARVTIPIGLDLTAKQLTDSAHIQKIIQDALTMVQERYADGVNFDFEDLIRENDTNSRSALTSVTKKITDTFHTAIPGSQVTFDAGWIPNIDVRYYDYLGIAKSCDFLFVMDYDEQSQIDGPCRAGATSDYRYLAKGMRAFEGLGIPLSQLVMGLPWYGHDFPCINMVNVTVCPLALAPWRDAQCTDLYAPEYPYADIMKNYLPKSTTGRMWDPLAKSPFMNYKDDKGHSHQIWYDDVESISEKISWAKAQDGLRGVGMFTADFLDYSDTKTSSNFWNSMNDFFM